MKQNSERYLGYKNAAVVCVNNVNGVSASGEFYHKYKRDGTEFANLDELIFRLEEFFDSINFPVSSTNTRSFVEKPRYVLRKENEVVNKDEQILERKGDLGTFIVRVQHRQNCTWQGKITWLEENKTVNFRSALEMIRLIESGIQSEEKVLEEVNWKSSDFPESQK